MAPFAKLFSTDDERETHQKIRIICLQISLSACSSGVKFVFVQRCCSRTYAHISASVDTSAGPLPHGPQRWKATYSISLLTGIQNEQSSWHIDCPCTSYLEKGRSNSR